MKVTKEKSDYGTNVFVEKDRKYVAFTYGSNGDLYWSIHNPKGNPKDATHDTFRITKENYGVYHLFEELYYDIENVHIYDIADEDTEGLTDEEVEKLTEETQLKNEISKEKYQKYSLSSYHELFNQEEQTITWYSDETDYETSNILRITKEKDSFLLDFGIQPSIEGYKEDAHSEYYIPIRFGSRNSAYEPFNHIFMRMYNKLITVDDVKDKFHQFHIDEYLYEEDQRLLKKIS